MHLKSIHVAHIKSLHEVGLTFGDADLPGWHVILGDNSSGKTTLIRAIALALVGPQEAMALREDWTRWVEIGEVLGTVSLDLTYDTEWDTATGTGRAYKHRSFEVALSVSKVTRTGNGNGTLPAQAQLEGNTPPRRYVWGSNRGWFSASFGPSRRFTGGNGDYQRVFFSNPRVARHLSAFSEQVALSEALMWLVERQRTGNGALVERVRAFLNGSHLLPHEVRLEAVTDQSLQFIDGNGVTVDVTELSDGYRSILSLALELLRQMEACYGLQGLFDPEGGHVLAPGVVLIDEIDAHLHPSWQTTVGDWFTSRFPNVQFIVATHSALVCRSIGATGRVFRLRAPGMEGGQVTEITGEDRDKLWYGSLGTALESAAFGLDVGRSAYGWERVEELRALTSASRSRDLAPSERERLQHLRSVLTDAGESYRPTER